MQALRLAPRRLPSRSRRHLSNNPSLVEILRQVQKGTITPEQAQVQIQEPDDNPLQAFANIDHRRSQRTGFPEAVFAEGKTPEQVARILDRMAEQQHGDAILATR